jgi:hypothetical protein
MGGAWRNAWEVGSYFNVTAGQIQTLESAGTCLVEQGTDPDLGAGAPGGELHQRTGTRSQPGVGKGFRYGDHNMAIDAPALGP